MPRIDPERLRRAICDPHLPGVLYILIWVKLEPGTAAHRALSEVLFDYEVADYPANAPNRDLSDVWVRQGVARCVAEYPEVREAAEKLLFPGFFESLRLILWRQWDRLRSRWGKDDVVINLDDD
jgi:hypothetical protein